MFVRNRVHSFIIFPLVLILSTASFSFSIPDKSKKSKHGNLDGTPVLWRAPKNIQARNLYLGPGGQAMQPHLSRVTFLEEEKGGYSTKYRVRDAAGREWVAKVGNEAQAETAAVRLLWALGYETEINYLAPRVNIEGKGTFTNVRFEARPEDVKRLDEWKWSQNPFVGTREFQGLKVMMALLNNWDIKDANNKILLGRNETGNELRYIISDLGATFGHSVSIPIVWRIKRSRSNPAKYAQAGFLDVVKDDFVYFNYAGKRGSLFGDISTEDARWIGNWLSLLSELQIRQAFVAANYTPSEVDTLTNEVKIRIKELVNVPVSRQFSRNRQRVSESN